MKRFKPLWYVALSLLTATSSLAQEKIVPATPEASALAKSINFPVGYNTGVPNISIPLHEVKAGTISLPISMSYHPGGFKINERPGDIGLGWSLNTNIQISRSIEGSDDLIPKPSDPARAGYYYNTINIGTRQSYEYFAALDGTFDWQPDRYNYNLLTKSGSFYWLKRPNLPPIAVTIPWTGIRIEYIGTNQFKITDTDGTVYMFGGNETPDNRQFVEFSINSPTPTVYAATTWKCSQIISPSQTDVINFTYRVRDVEHVINLNERIELFTDPSTCGLYANFLRPSNFPNADTWDEIKHHPFYRFTHPKFFAHSMGPDAGFHMIWNDGITFYPVIEDYYDLATRNNVATTTTIKGLLPQEISFRGGALLFTGTGISVTGIEVRNYMQEEIRTFEFVQSSCQPVTGIGGVSLNIPPTRYLDQLKIKRNNTVVETYGFTYDKHCFGGEKGSDLWGGVSLMTGKMFDNNISVPWQILGNYDFPIYANCQTVPTTIDGFGTWGAKDVEESTVQAGILKKITYPGGGYTEFTFEANQLMTDEVNEYMSPVGGLRIQRIKYYDNIRSEIAFEKIYKYGENENGSGKLKIIPDTEGLENGWGSGYHYSQMRGYVDVAHWNNLSVKDPYMKQILTWEEKTIYPANTFRDMTFTSGATIFYTTVTEYQEEMGQLTGKTMYEYDKDVFNSYNPSYWMSGTNISAEETDWHMGQLKKEIHYKYTGTGFELVSEKKYTHLEYSKPDLVYVEKIYQKNEYFGLDDHRLYTESDFESLSYGLKVGTMLPETMEETWKENGQSQTRTTKYYYDNLEQHLHPSRREVTLNNGAKEITYTSYAPDYAAPPSSFIGRMQTKHMISSPIESVTTKLEGSTERIIAGSINTYESDGRGLPSKKYVVESSAPINLASFKFSNATPGSHPEPYVGGPFQPDAIYKEKLWFHYDLQDNTMLVLPKDNMRTGYIWDYQGLYPIAEVKNVLSTYECAYTSFEADGGGGWDNLNSQQVLDEVNAPSGTRYYTLTTGNAITRQLSVDDTYIITYWSKNGAYNVNGTGGNAINQASLGAVSWTCYLHRVVNPIDGLVTINGNGAIDELRLYPVGAQMTTYSYKPLAGIISSCDAANRLSFFEYDEFLRLQHIRDQDKNITKKFDYKYKVNEHGSPVWAMTGLNRCKPCALNGNYNSRMRQYQLRDNNSNSSTYNQTRWEDMEESYLCPDDPGWQTTGTAQCLTDGNGYRTGIQRAEQKAMNPCSGSYNNTRTVDVSNPTACPLNAPNWQSTQDTRCIGTSGMREKKEVDNNPHSATYNQERWVYLETNCTVCPGPAKWINLSSTRCQPGAIDGSYERFQRDTNSCSQTFQQTQWVYEGKNCTTCPAPPNWQEQTIPAPYCKVVANRVTGEVVKVQKDVNPCSSSFGQTQTVTVLNETVCPPDPPIWITLYFGSIFIDEMTGEELGDLYIEFYADSDKTIPYDPGSIDIELILMDPNTGNNVYETYTCTGSSTFTRVMTLTEPDSDQWQFAIQSSDYYVISY